MIDQDRFASSYSEIYDALHEEKPYADECELILNESAEVLGHRPQAVLDLACGTGRHLLEFARLGLSIYGNDVSPDMIERTRERLEKAGIKAGSLSVRPMQELDLKTIGASPFQLVTALYTALGYLPHPSDLDRFFRNLRSLLAPGGCFFADVWNGAKMNREFSASRTRACETPEMIIERRSEVSHLPRLNALHVHFFFEVTRKATGAQERFDEQHLVRYHFLTEIEQILLAHGFRLAAHGPFFDEAIESCESWNFFFIAQKVD